MFTLPPAVLARMREQAALAFQQHISFYDLTITRDVYGNEITSSGLLGTYPCYIGRAGKTDTEEEIAERLVTAGVIQDKNILCLLPYNVTVPPDVVCVVSGQVDEWILVGDNTSYSPNHRLYTKLILNRKEQNTNYRDRIGKNKM